MHDRMKRQVKSKYHWTGWHLSTVEDYFAFHSKFYEYRKLPLVKRYDGVFLIYASPESSPVHVKTARFFTQWIKQFFVVPRLKKSLEIENCLNMYQPVEVFLGFLLRLLSKKPDSAFNRIGDLEKELRFLHTVVGDTSFMQCGEQEEFEKLLSEFEAVANEAGRFVHFLLFSAHPAFNKSNKRLAVVLNKIDHLKGNILKFLNLLPFIMTRIPPKTSVVDVLPIVGSLVHDLEDFMNREDNRIAEAEDQIRALHQGLISFQSSIDDFGSPRPSQIGELKEPLMQIGDLAHEAEYLIVSCFNGEAPCWYLNSRLTRVNHSIGLTGAKIQEIMKEHKAGGLLHAKYFSSKLSLSVEKNIEVDNDTVVFADNEIYILDQLVGQGEGRQVISIYGMPGLGKTTFAKRMYNNQSVIERFDRRSWCVISQTYNRRRVLTDILNDLTSDFRGDEEERLVECIHQQLMRRRYLIVIDDIWDPDDWNDLQRCFPDDENGSRILLTTRIKDVARHSLLHRLPLLTDDQCWELLEKKVFGNERCPLELQGTGKQIAKSCSGLPLTVVVTAGILLTLDKKERAWAEVSKYLAQHIDGDNSVMQILELSYMYLPECLKPCFLYFGQFGEDTEIPVGKLLRLWISEGFVAKEEGKRAENVAEEYLMELIDKSLVMIGKRRSDGGVKTCFLHDLLRDMCLKLSVEEKFIQFVKIDDPLYKKGQRIQVTSFDNVFLSWSCQHVRSLHSNEHSESYVRDMRLLRVLHLNCCYAEPPVGIEYLVNLRYLVIGDLPASIGSLVNLEYLRVEHDDLRLSVAYLSQPILRMGKLRYLVVRLYGALYGEDCNSSQTNNLECLSGIRIRDDRDVEMLKSSPHLRKLKFRSIYFEREYSLDLCFLTKLESLSIGRIGRNLEISFPTNLKKLTLFHFYLAWEEMSIIGRLGNLEILKISGVQPSYPNNRIWETTEGEFQKLKFLKLDHVINLIQWNVASSEHFPNLRRLILIHCWDLQVIPPEIGETLEMLEIRGGCLESLVDSVNSIQNEQREMGNENLRVITTDMYRHSA